MFGVAVVRAIGVHPVWGFVEKDALGGVQGEVYNALANANSENDPLSNLVIFSHFTPSGLDSETEELLRQCLDLYQRPEKTIRVLYLPAETTNDRLISGYTVQERNSGTTLSSNIWSTKFPDLKLGKFEGTILMIEGGRDNPIPTSTLAHEVSHALDLFHVSETSPPNGATTTTPEDPWHRLMLRLQDSAPLNTKRFAPSEHQQFETKPSVYFKTSTAP